MKKLPLLGLFVAVFLFPFIAISQKAVIPSEENGFEKIAVQYRFDSTRALPSYVQFSKNNGINEATFFQKLSSVYNISNDFNFVLANEVSDQIGQIHRNYQQYFSGIKVAYSVLKTHSENGKVIAFNGNFIKQVPKTTSPGISKELAFQKALDFVGAESYYGDLANFYSYELKEQNGSLRFLPNFLTVDESKSLALCYEFNLYAKEPFNRTLIFVNAATGEIVFTESQVHEGNSKGTAVTGYSDTQSITTDSLSTVFRLRDTLRGNGVETYNAQRTRNYAAAIDFTDNDNFWNNFNTNLNQYATDAHWGTQKFYDYLDSVFQRNSIDGLGFTLKSYVHVDNNLVNAFWDGQRMSYGDGNGTTFSPLTTLDIVGHEIAHGLTDFTSDLIYANESGALNESFSDIFGTTIEFWARSNRANWTIGEDIGGAFRSMLNPKQFGDPDTYEGQFWIDQDCIPTSGNDRCGVHTNSGVQNKWFYLLSEGGIGVNDMADSFQVNGIGIQKAEQIAYRNLTIYLNPSSNFDDARFYAIVSAIDLYGACSPEVEATTNAWHAVGVGNRYESGVSAEFGAQLDTAFCFTPVAVQFFSSGSNVQQFTWVFGNGDSSNSRTPVVLFDSLGVFDVSLFADGGTCGSDTIVKSNYIVIDTSISCAYFLGNTTNTIVSDCEGRLFDSGGLNGSYDLNVNGEFVIDVPFADFITLDFVKLEVEAGTGFSCNRDYVEVFDGIATNAKSLGRFCANHLPQGNQIITSTNKVKIKFRSDRLNSAPGFLIEWACQSASLPPIADFSANVDTSCTGQVKFKNLTNNTYTQQIWDFGDGTFSTEQNPSHLYNSNGNFDVRLIASNSVGSDTVVKSSIVNINRPLGPNSISDTFCLGQRAGFRINTTETLLWYRDTTTNSIFTGDTITIGFLQRDTTLYVKELARETSFFGGKMLNTGAGNYSNDNDYIEFDVHEPIIIESILFFPNRSGNRTLDIRNNRGEIVQSKELFIPGSPLLVTVNVTLDADTNYRISISDRETGLFKNTSGASFPYQISNLVTLKGSNLPSGEYPYFFRWKVKALDCESTFSTVKAILDTTCVVTGIEAINANQEESFRIYPNPVNNQLNIVLNDFVANQTYEISIYSAQGQLVYFEDNLKKEGPHQELNVDFSSFASGLYVVQLRNNQFIQTKKLIKSE